MAEKKQWRKSCPPRERSGDENQRPATPPKVERRRTFDSVKNGIPTWRTSPIIPTVVSAIARLEAGVVVTLISPKRQPENLTLYLRQDSGQLVFVRSIGSKPVISVHLEQIQEVIMDSKSRLARRWEEVNKQKFDQGITILYGNSFILHIVTVCLAKSDTGGDDLLDCIQFAVSSVVQELKDQSFFTHKQRWLRQEFNKIQISTISALSKKSRSISIRNVHRWLTHHGCKISKNFITLKKESFNFPDELQEVHFATLMSALLETNLTVEIMKKYGTASRDHGKRQLPLSDFKIFLEHEQKESRTNNAIDRMLACIPASFDGSTPELIFNETMMEDYLFSPENSIMNPIEKSVHQDMDFPLTNYWIASSHNTYLISGQFKGESSVEAYARCLRMGCRCIELDCWDGPDGKPIITHGRTLTSSIKFSDVVQTIKEHAWVASDYPLILSIENHCSLSQQRIMATNFKEVFGDELLTSPINVKEDKMPSPNQLRRKIIIKNKKLQHDGKTWQDSRLTHGEYSDLTNARKKGTLHLKYVTERKWMDFDVILTDTHLGFTPTIPSVDEEDEADIECLYDDDSDSDDEEDAFEDARPLSSQLWYHGKMDRKTSENLLKKFRHYGDGTFLIRDGTKGPTVSFVTGNEVVHSIIQVKANRYLVGNEVWHNNLPEMVDYYRHHNLTYPATSKSPRKPISVNFTHGVKKELGFEGETWFYQHFDRACAESFLQQIPINGVYLVRPSSSENCFTLSVRCQRHISHFQIEYSRGKFVLGNSKFSKMSNLIKYFSKHPIHRGAKLSQHASEELVEGGAEDVYSGGDLYMEPNSEKPVTVRALYDFHAFTPEELSFKKDSYITNVIIVDEPWWRGDHGPHEKKLFPANYVQIVDGLDDVGEGAVVESMLQLSECYITPEVQYRDEVCFFTVNHRNNPGVLELGSRSKEEVDSWVQRVNESMAQLGEQVEELQRQEKSKKLAQELSDLVVYCQAVPYNQGKKGRHCEMSSFSEEKILKDDKSIIQYNQFQISRVYPKFSRVTSSNYDPLPRWNVGCQMCALNYQTPDRGMQLNQAKFQLNGGCGYVLKPSFMNNTHYNPCDVKSLPAAVEKVVLTIKVLGGRNLAKEEADTGVVQPFVAIEIIGLPLDNQRVRTRTRKDENVLNPVWKDETFVFQVSCPDLAFLRFEVGNEVNTSSTVSQATFPFRSLLDGYRSVQLKNVHSEEIPLSTLLVHIDRKNPKEEKEKEMFKGLEDIRRRYMELSASSDTSPTQLTQLVQMENTLLEMLDRSRLDGYHRNSSISSVHGRIAE